MECDFCEKVIPETEPHGGETKLGWHFCCYSCLESFYCDEIPENEDFIK